MANSLFSEYWIQPKHNPRLLAASPKVAASLHQQTTYQFPRSGQFYHYGRFHSRQSRRAQGEG